VNRQRVCVLTAVGIWLAGWLAQPAVGQEAEREAWSEVAPAISYREWTLPGPVRVFVAAADRAKDNWTIDTMTSMGTVQGGTETVPDMVTRYDDAADWQGRRHEIKVAINGDYYNMRTGYALGGQVIGGWFLKRFGEYSGSSGFVWCRDRRCFIGGNLRNGAEFQEVRFADGGKMNIHRLNDARGKDELALFTYQYAANTGTSDDGVEVLARMAEPLAVFSPDDGARGKIVAVHRDKGSTVMPFDHVVLSGHGQAAERLLKAARVGQEVRVDLRLQDFGHEEGGLSPQNWRGAQASLGNPVICLVNGKVTGQWEAKAERYAAEGRRHGSVVRDPRTAIAFNDQRVYFIVIDGRMEQSVGMTFTEVAEFCRDQLQATGAVLQDGGGSSTLWVDGKVRNVPSTRDADGKPGKLRPVANGWYIALEHDAQRSEAFAGRRAVRTAREAELRLGPGSQYTVATRLPAGQACSVLDHSLNGTYAKGTHWWNCRAAAHEGWLSEGDLAAAR